MYSIWHTVHNLAINIHNTVFHILFDSKFFKCFRLPASNILYAVRLSAFRKTCLALSSSHIWRRCVESEIAEEKGSKSKSTRLSVWNSADKVTLPVWEPKLCLPCLRRNQSHVTRRSGISLIWTKYLHSRNASRLCYTVVLVSISAIKVLIFNRVGDSATPNVSRLLFSDFCPKSKVHPKF